MHDLLTLFDWTPDRVAAVVGRAADLKAQFAAGERPPLLAGKFLVQIYDKPSLRTRLSFEAAMVQSGGSAAFLSRKEAGFDGRESAADVARVIGAMADGIVVRTFEQRTVEEIAAGADCPLINGLTDDYHPCQALADLLTLREEFGADLSGRRVAFVGDGNNVARSLAVACGKVGVSMVLCHPDGYGFDPKFLARLQTDVPGSDLTEEADPAAAVAGADAVYTDVWASMGRESETETRKKAFDRYRVDAALMSAAPKHALFLHCLPAHRGDEVTDAVIDGPRSRAFEQAANRMHLARGLLAELLA